MRISDWSSDVCSSDLSAAALRRSLCLQSRPWHRPGYAAGARGPDDGADPRLARNRGPRAMSRTAVVLFNLGGPDRPEAVRSEERRVGKGCVRTCRSRCVTYHSKKKQNAKPTHTQITTNNQQ